MTSKKFYDWQTAGGTDDVMRLVDCLERADVAWCAIGGVAVNHWAKQPMVTQDVDFVVASDAIEQVVSLLEEAGFRSERFEWSINFKGRSAVTVQLSTEEFYRDFPSRAVPADVHGILLRVASLEDTLRGKIKAWSEPERSTAFQKSVRTSEMQDGAGGLEGCERPSKGLQRKDVSVAGASWRSAELASSVLTRHRGEAPVEDIVSSRTAGRNDVLRQSKRIKDLADIARLVESHPQLWDFLSEELRRQLQPPA